MFKASVALFLLVLAACSGVPRAPETTSPCLMNEASYECQIERYQNVDS